MAPSALQDMRIVQLGWASGPEVVGRIVKPEGFVITPDATEKHAITQDHAMQEGLPLKASGQVDAWLHTTSSSALSL